VDCPPPVEADVEGEDVGLGVWTAPNVVTMVRLACIPLFGLAALRGASPECGRRAPRRAGLPPTGWNGQLARRFHQVSNLGKILDRSLIAVGADRGDLDHRRGRRALVVRLATIAREVLVSAAVLILAGLGASRIDVLWVGKAGTFALMFAYRRSSSATANAAVWRSRVRIVAAITGQSSAHLGVGGGSVVRGTGEEGTLRRRRGPRRKRRVGEHDGANVPALPTHSTSMRDAPSPARNQHRGDTSTSRAIVANPNHKGTAPRR